MTKLRLYSLQVFPAFEVSYGCQIAEEAAKQAVSIPEIVRQRLAS
jgi:hypothetical protein